MKTVVTFGEIMGRLCPPGQLRYRQALPGGLDMTFAGAEANVAASLAQLGGTARFVTALPDHTVADACVATLRSVDVDASYILRTDEGRLGLYYLEGGANQRPSRVIYDRSHSSVSMTPGDAYAWADIFADAGWLHITGITPALSRIAADATRTAARTAKEAGLTVSCDLNFRKKLWRWDAEKSPKELAGATMRTLLPYVDIVIANEEDADDVLGIRAADTDVDAGHLAVENYRQVAEQIVTEFPNVSKVGTTLRESVSASHNNWGAMLYDAGTKQSFFAPTRDGDYAPYEIRNIVDRVGGGDSFAAGLIFSFNTPELSDPETALRFATAASCLCHSVYGDWNFSNRAEVEALMGGSVSGRVVR